MSDASATPLVVRTSQSGIIPDTPGPLPEISGLIPDNEDIDPAFQVRTGNSGIRKEICDPNSRLGCLDPTTGQLSLEFWLRIPSQEWTSQHRQKLSPKTFLLKKIIPNRRKQMKKMMIEFPGQ